MRQTLPFSVSKSQLFLQDKDIDLDDITELEDSSVFTIESMPARSYEKDRFVQMDISIEMNLNQTTLARTGYTVLDVLSDVGGIQSIIMSAIGLVLGILNYNNFDNYMASRLYKADRNSGQMAARSKHEEMEPTRWMNFFEWLLDLTPRFLRCQCCRKSQRMQEMEVAREKLAQEVNIVEIVRSRRLIYQALKLLLTER